MNAISISPPHIFFNSILASRTNGTFGFASTHKADPSAKPKEPLFSLKIKNNNDIHRQEYNRN